MLSCLRAFYLIARIASAITILADQHDLHALPAEPKPEEVIVVANVNSPESLELANFYLKHRSIPSHNLIVVKTSTDEVISREVFVNEILNPIRHQLIEKHFVDGKLDEQIRDFHGRFEFYAYDTHFKYLVTCLGIPLKIQNQLLQEPDIPQNLPDIFRKTQASVDSELSLITAPNKAYISWMPNPLFEVSNPTHFDYSTAISVCRLDGASLEDAKRLITDAIQAEEQPFVAGRAYIDLNNNHRDGNLWLRQAASQLREYGYDVDIIPTTHHWSCVDRNDAPAVYLGWYQPHASGPMIRHQVPTGAIGAHIHSYSAGSIRTTDHNWVGPLIHAGFAVTFGNVYEPYLQLTLRPDRFIEHLLRGYCVGDASLFALPTLSWQSITIGDPLYRPFKANATWSPEPLIKEPNANPYLCVAAINRVASRDLQRAVELAFDAYILHPNLTLAFKILLQYIPRSSPTLIDLLYDYVAATTEIDESLAPQFITIYHQLVERGDTERSLKIRNLLLQNCDRWDPELTASVRSL